MRKKQTRISKLALATLKKTAVAVLATVASGSKPHATAVFITVDDDFTVYFATREGTHKASNIRTNPDVALTVGLEPPAYVQMEGTAQEVRDVALRSAIIDRLAKAASNNEYVWPPIVRMDNLGKYVIYRVKPRSVFALDFADQTIYSTESVITKIA